MHAVFRVHILEETQMSVLSTTEIMAIIPHRYPMLMLDTVEELIPGEKAVALKNISVNEEISRPFPR